MKKNDTEQYINIPIWFIKLTSNRKSPIYLTPFERELYRLIFGLCNKNKCYANDQYFKNVFNVTIKHINSSIHKLERLNLINIIHNNNKRTIEIAKVLDKDTILFSKSKDEKFTYITTTSGVYEFLTTEYKDMNNENSENYNPDFLQNLLT